MPRYKSRIIVIRNLTARAHRGQHIYVLALYIRHTREKYIIASHRLHSLISIHRLGILGTETRRVVWDQH
jgi:hypothetical protein